MENLWDKLKTNGIQIMVVLIVLHIFCNLFFSQILFIIKVMLFVTLIAYLKGVYERNFGIEDNNDDN